MIPTSQSNKPPLASTTQARSLVFTLTARVNTTVMGAQGFLLSGVVFTTINVPTASASEVSNINNKGVMVGWYYDSAGARLAFIDTPQRICGTAKLRTSGPGSSVRDHSVRNGGRKLRTWNTYFPPGQVDIGSRDQPGTHRPLLGGGVVVVTDDPGNFPRTVFVS